MPTCGKSASSGCLTRTASASASPGLAGTPAAATACSPARSLHKPTSGSGRPHEPHPSVPHPGPGRGGARVPARACRQRELAALDRPAVRRSELVAIVVANGEAVPRASLDGECDAHHIALFTSPQPSPHVIDVLRLYLPHVLAEIDDAARRVPRRARDGRADHRRVGDRQERARARAHLARPRPRRRRHRRALADLARHDRGPLPAGAARLPRGARPRRAQHPHDLRRDRGAPAQAPEAHRAPRGPRQRGVLRARPPAGRRARTRRSSACRSAR